MDSIASQLSSKSDQNSEAVGVKENEDHSEENSNGHEDWAEVLGRYRERGMLNFHQLLTRSKSNRNSTSGYSQREIYSTRGKFNGDSKEHKRKHSSPTGHRQLQHDVDIGTGHCGTIRAVNPRPMTSKAKYDNENRGIFSGILVKGLNPNTNTAQLAVHVQRELPIQVRPERMPTKYNCSYIIRCNRTDSRKFMNAGI